MTIARDIHTGAVVGQVSELALKRDDETQPLPILTRDGIRYVDRSSVRLEEISDR